MTDHTKSERDRARHLHVVEHETVTRYVITHVISRGLMSGVRGLTFAKQGRCTYATRDEAETALGLYKRPGGLSRVLDAAELASLEVREAQCYPGHFDPVKSWFD